MNTEKQRAEFEAHFKHLDLTRKPDSWGVMRYKYDAISLALEAWQAARRAPVVPQDFVLVPVNPSDEQLSHLLSPGEKLVMEQQPLPREVILHLAIEIAGLRDLYASFLNSIPPK